MQAEGTRLSRVVQRLQQPADGGWQGEGSSQGEGMPCLPPPLAPDPDPGRLADLLQAARPTPLGCGPRGRGRPQAPPQLTMKGRWSRPQRGP